MLQTAPRTPVARSILRLSTTALWTLVQARSPTLARTLLRTQSSTALAPIIARRRHPSLFGGTELRPHQARGQFAAMPRYRPVSIYSIDEDSESARENYAMVTMLDGGHVRRSSVASVVGGSPLARAGGKRRNAATRSPIDNVVGSDLEIKRMEMPNKVRLVEARLVEKPSATESLRSVSSNIFDTERMGRAHLPSTVRLLALVVRDALARAHTRHRRRSTRRLFLSATARATRAVVRYRMDGRCLMMGGTSRRWTRAGTRREM
ncbi:hypothetical protein PENSPDRAFT_332835 [Peniophora sp. CONT]|nr:hypothetical protein PENSPDRAFT_332835 [Peniophora sp. CONT]